ncbi:MAG: type II secretion system F family protein, partial [Candidatus Saccharimonadales bacterium]
MQSFTYVAHDSKTGQKVQAEIDASDESTAAKLLVQRGLSPLEINQVSRQASFFDSFRNRVPTKQKVIFSRQLSTLLNAGLPLVQSLSAVRNQATNKTLNQILGEV